jgi:hypothetical protein
MNNISNLPAIAGVPNNYLPATPQNRTIKIKMTDSLRKRLEENKKLTEERGISKQKKGDRIKVSQNSDNHHTTVDKISRNVMKKKKSERKENTGHGKLKNTSEKISALLEEKMALEPTPNDPKNVCDIKKDNILDTRLRSRKENKEEFLIETEIKSKSITDTKTKKINRQQKLLILQKKRINKSHTRPFLGIVVPTIATVVPSVVHTAVPTNAILIGQGENFNFSKQSKEIKQIADPLSLLQAATLTQNTLETPLEKTQQFLDKFSIKPKQNSAPLQVAPTHNKFSATNNGINSVNNGHINYPFNNILHAQNGITENNRPSISQNIHSLPQNVMPLQADELPLDKFAVIPVSYQIFFALPMAIALNTSCKDSIPEIISELSNDSSLAELIRIGTPKLKRHRISPILENWALKTQALDVSQLSQVRIETYALDQKRKCYKLTDLVNPNFREVIRFYENPFKNVEKQDVAHWDILVPKPQ